MSLIRAGVDLEVINCWVCGCTFAMSPTLKNNMKSRGDTLHCPKGCKLGLGEPHWKKNLERAQSDADYYLQRSIENRASAERTQRQLSATRGVVTRIKNRVGKGVCPCCNRHFENLQRHMETEHSDYSAESD